MNRRITFLCICLLATFALQAQTFTGKVVDEKSQPLPYANVVLLSLPDSAFVTGTVSDESGSFTLRSEKPDLLLRVSSIGYATIYNKVEKSDLGTIQLMPDTQLLGEVVVKGDLPKVRLKGDAMVTNVAGTILEKAGTGNDLLDRIPGVSADDGTVNVFGSGNAVIYINGRKMRNSSELDQLSSDNIKSVEVVRNPGARYDASVKAVVRIITKKAQGEGFGFNNRFYTSYQYDWSVLDQFNFNYRKEGFDLGGMLFGVNQKFEDNKAMIQRTYLDKVWEQASDITSPYHSQTLSAMLSLNYQFNENHSLGARYDFDRRPKNMQHIDMETFVTQNGDEYEENQSMGMSNYTDTKHLLNMYYNGRAGDWSIDFNADGMWTESKNPQYTDERTTPADGVQEEQSVTTLALTENRLYAAKLIAEHPLWEGNLSIGTEYTYSSQMSQYTNKEGILEDNHNDIKENAVSAFVEYAHSFGKLQAQAGVRYEHLNSDYYVDGVKSGEQSRVYDNVFPSVSLALPVGKVQAQLSYSGNIKRPDYYYLRSGISYINRYTYESGNPYMKPAIEHVVSLNMSYSWLYLNVNYIHGKDVEIQYSRAYSEENPAISLLTRINAPEIDKLNATFTLSPSVGFWSPQLTLMFNQQWFMVDTPEGRRNFNNPMGMFQWDNTFTLPKDFQFNLNMTVSTCGNAETVRYLEPYGSLDCSIYKSFFSGRFSLQLKAYDLLNTAQPKCMLYCGNRTVMVDAESRRSIAFTLRYKFNAAKSKYKGTGAGQDQRSRM